MMLLAPAASERLALSSWAQAATELAGAFACLAAAVHTRGQGPPGVGALRARGRRIWAATDATFAWLQTAGREIPEVSPLDIGWLAFYGPRRAGHDPPLPEAAPRARRAGADRRPDHHGRRGVARLGDRPPGRGAERRGRALRDAPRRPLPGPRPALPDHAGLDRAAAQAPCARLALLGGGGLRPPVGRERRLPGLHPRRAGTSTCWPPRRSWAPPGAGRRPACSASGRRSARGPPARTTARRCGARASRSSAAIGVVALAAAAPRQRAAGRRRGGRRPDGDPGDGRPAGGPRPAHRARPPAGDRPPHRRLQPPLPRRGDRARLRARLPRRARRSRRSPSISTASRRSTTGSGTRPATGCCRRPPPRSAPACAPATSSAGSAATSS